MAPNFNSSMVVRVGSWVFIQRRAVMVDTRWTATKTLGAFIVGLVTVVGGVIGIYSALKSSGPPSFSGDIGHYSDAANFVSFLSQHDSQHVKLDVNCIQRDTGPYQSGPCILTSNGNDMRVYSNITAAKCWNNTPGGPCSNAVLLTFSQSPGASGTFSGYGAGYYFIRGDWVVRDQGSGSSTPEGDEAYELVAVSPTSN
jgi:hypothetical protein